MWSPMRLTAFHFIRSLSTIPLSQKKDGWRGVTYYDACSCIFMRRLPAQPPFALSRRHLGYIHNDQHSGSCSLRCLGLSLCQAESQPSTSLVLEPRLGFWSSKLLDVRLLESVLRKFPLAWGLTGFLLYRVSKVVGRGRNWHGLICSYFKHGVKLSFPISSS